MSRGLFPSILSVPIPAFRLSSLPARIFTRSLFSIVQFRSLCSPIEARRRLATIVPMPVAQSKPEITADVGGQHNVERLMRISRDFRSAYMRPQNQTGSRRLMMDPSSFLDPANPGHRAVLLLNHQAIPSPSPPTLNFSSPFRHPVVTMFTARIRPHASSRNG